jgi:tetratricopeptide (TPR) repeat protein
MTEGLLKQGVDWIHVAVPQPEALRALARREAALSDVLLSAGVRLVEGEASSLLREQRRPDLLLEMAHTPWADAHQGIPSRWALKTRRKALSSDGVYLLGVDLHWLTEAQLKALLYDFSEVFPQIWAFLPPKGADQLILAGWQSPQPLEWTRFVQVLQKAPTLLSRIEIRSPLDLADRALCNRDGLADLKDPSGAWKRQWMLNLQGERGPLLPMFRTHVATEKLFPNEEDLSSILHARGEATEAFLSLLADNAQGKLEQVFKTSRALIATETGARNLDPLIAPYLKGAKAAITRGRAQGGVSAWDSARTKLTAALLLNPNSAEAHGLMGEVHLAMGRLGSAASSFLRALDLQPGLRDPLLGLGQVAIRRKDLPAAETHLRKAQTAHSRDWLCAYNLGAFLMDRGLLEEAESFLRKAATLAEGKQAPPHAALAQLYLQRGEATAALLEAHRAIGLEKNAMNAYVLGKAYFEVEQTSSATQYFQRAILADPSFWQARAGMGVIFAEVGEWSRCVDAFERVLALNPNNQPAQQNLAQCRTQIEMEAPSP